MQSDKTINGVPFALFEHHADMLHRLMCRANLVKGNGVSCSFNGWTADGRAVRHRIHLDGYERTGPRVEVERKEREDRNGRIRANVERAVATQEEPVAPSYQEVIAAALDALEDNDNHAATVILKTAARGVPVGYVLCRQCGHTVKNRECGEEESKNCTAMHRPHDAGVLGTENDQGEKR